MQISEKASDEIDRVKWIMDKLSGKIGSENLAYIMMTVATSVFALGFLYSNEHNFDVCETFLVRSISLIAINFSIARVYGMDLSYQDPYNFRILLARNFLVGIQNTMFTLAQFYLSQPIVQTMNTSSILFIFILDYFLNGVTLTKKQFYGVIFGILGVLLTVNGDLIISTINPGFERQSEF
jgi:drug/metabolite transporter (DMT)-like permease